LRNPTLAQALFADRVFTTGEVKKESGRYIDDRLQPKTDI